STERNSCFHFNAFSFIAVFSLCVHRCFFLRAGAATDGPRVTRRKIPESAEAEGRTGGLGACSAAAAPQVAPRKLPARLEALDLRRVSEIDVTGDEDHRPFHAGDVEERFPGTDLTEIELPFEEDEGARVARAGGWSSALYPVESRVWVIADCRTGAEGPS